MAEIDEELNAEVRLANRIITYKAMALKTPQERRKAGWAKTMLDGRETQWKLFFETDLKLQRHATEADHKTPNISQPMDSTRLQWNTTVLKMTS